MNNPSDNFISEIEAASIAKVSVNTLKRFAEAGYLKSEAKAEGLKFYSTKDLSSVFGINIKAKTSPVEISKNLASSIEKTTVVESNEAEEDDAGYLVDLDEEESPLSEQLVNESQAQPNKAETELNQEIQTLRNVVSLQEKILDMKDKLISDLEEQRTWLRARVEKLEDKGDRDQMMLLAEAQTIRKLVGGNNNGKSSIRAALEWFGVVEKESDFSQDSNKQR